MRKQCINELKQEQVQKQFVQYVHMTWWYYWSDCRRSLNASSDLASTSSTGSAFKTGMVLVGIYRRPKTLKLLGMTSSFRLLPWNWLVLRREFNHASNDLEKHVQPAMESAGLKWTSGSQPKSLTIADTEVSGLVRRWGTLLMNLAALRWTIFSWSTYFCWYGSQVQQQYSSLGRTIALYDFSFNSCGHLFRDRQRNPNKRFAAPLILSICSFHRSLLHSQTKVHASISGTDWFSVHDILMTDFVACCIGDGNNVRFLHMHSIPHASTELTN